MMGDEHDAILKEARDLVEMRGGHAWRLHQGGRVQGDAGILDMFALLRVPRGEGVRWVPVFFDAKTDGYSTLSPAQAVFVERCARAGVPCVHGRAGDLEDLIRRLERPETRFTDLREIVAGEGRP